MNIQKNCLRGIRVCHDDLPESFCPSEKGVAIDTETLGLRAHRDRLCLVQCCGGDGICYLVQIAQNPRPAPRLMHILSDDRIEKLFHFARFDVGILYTTFGVLCTSIYCTKIASKLCRTYTERHGLRELCRELLHVDLHKGEQCSYWGAEQLSDAQKSYAASDVLYLHSLRERLDAMLQREGRTDLFRSVCAMLPQRVVLDAHGFEDDIFAH